MSSTIGGTGSLHVDATVVSSHSSATGGPLPQANTTTSDVQLENVLMDAVAGILNLPHILVRPRWQPRPPKQPEPTVNWVAIGITTRTPMDYPYIKHFNGGPDRLTRWSSFTAMASVYGPGCQELAEQLRDGFYIDQNREQLSAIGVKLTDAGEITAVPELFNIQWINRADLTLRFARAVDREYNVLDIVSSEGTIATQNGVESEWNVNP